MPLTFYHNVPPLPHNLLFIFHFAAISSGLSFPLLSSSLYPTPSRIFLPPHLLPLLLPFSFVFPFFFLPITSSSSCRRPGKPSWRNILWRVMIGAGGGRGGGGGGEPWDAGERRMLKYLGMKATSGIPLVESVLGMELSLGIRNGEMIGCWTAFPYCILCISTRFAKCTVGIKKTHARTYYFVSFCKSLLIYMRWYVFFLEALCLEAEQDGRLGKKV